MHQLGSYLKFFNILREMEAQKQIDAREKQLLRINFTTKERRLMLILEELDDDNEEEFRFSLINYIKQSETQQKQLFKRSSSRSRSSITAISPLIKKQIEIIDDEQVQKDLDQAIKLISNAINSAHQGNEIHKKLMKIQQQIAVINSQQQDLEFQEISVCGEQEIQLQYKNLKAQFEEYIHIHSEIIENELNYNSISTLLKAFLKTLINIDNFSFIALKEATDSQTIVEDPKYITEVTTLPVLKICKIGQNSELSQLLKAQDTSFAFATPKRVFFFHTETDIPIEQIVNDYNLFEEVSQICQFLSESVDHAIAKIFSPTSIADMILDIAISFVRCSKYIFIHTMNKVFNDVASESQRDWIKEQLKTLSVQHNKLDAKIQAKIRKQILEHETLTYVNKLEESNPEMKNSVASLYMPFSQSVKQRTKSIEHLKPLDSYMHPIRHSEMPLKKSVQLARTHQISNFGFHQFDGIQGIKDSDSPILETGQKEFKKSKFDKSGSPRLELSSFSLDQNDDIVDTFDFNVMEIKSACLKHKAVWSIMQKNNFIEDYQIPCEILQKFLEQVQFHYNQTNNPYHNYDHGVTVMQTSHYLLLQCDMDALDDLQKFSLIMSALCHDVGHTGRTNLFEINSLSELAIRYHDKSVLEQHHAALTIQLLKNEQSNILVNVTSEQFRNFRKSLIQNILNTDMSEHFRLIKDFENRTAEVDPKLLCGVMMHVSDFGGTIKAPQLSRQWSQRVNQEFIAQFKQEEELGYPTQPYMKDLDKAHVMAKSEIGFLKVIVRPIVLILSQFLNDKLQHCVDNIDKSVEHWENIK